MLETNCGKLEKIVTFTNYLNTPLQQNCTFLYELLYIYIKMNRKNRKKNIRYVIPKNRCHFSTIPFIIPF